MPNKPTACFSAEEKAAMKERARELKAAARKSATDADGEADVLAKIAELPESDREMAMRVHMLIKSAVPTLSPRTWYGMPAYTKDGNVVCFFQSGQKFKTRYSTLGFQQQANLDDGAMWPTSYALSKLNFEVEAIIIELRNCCMVNVKCFGDDHIQGYFTRGQLRSRGSNDTRRTN